MFKMILAADRAGNIGLNNGLPWNCPEDLKHFKELTMGGTLIMGYNTYRSLPTYPKGLPNRKNLVIVRAPSDAAFAPEGVRFITMDDVYELFELDQDAWIIGGKNTYELLANFCDVLWLTLIDGEHEADTSVCLPLLIGNKQSVERRKLSETAVAVRYVNYGARNG